MSYISSFIGKRSFSLSARIVPASRPRPSFVAVPLASEFWTNFATLRERHSQRRSMVMVTQTMSSVEIDASKNSSDTFSNKTEVTEDVAFADQENLQSVFVTEACYRRIHHLISLKQRKDLYLRVFVDAGGCSGFTYQFEIDSDENLKPEEDVIFTEPSTSCIGLEPARVVVDKGSLQLIAGSKIDYIQEMIKSSFEVRENPQSESACGCGSSFALKNFSSNPAVD
jgi:iron-sulfur cluster assembly accessory protein